MTVLVLRPQPEADETARWLRERGHEAIVSPLLAAAPGDPPPPAGGVGAVAVTSPRALRAAEALNERPPLFVVGERCAALARDAGWTVAATAPDARALVAPLVARGAAVIHAAPEERAFDLEAALRERGVVCATWTAYRMEPLSLVPAARAALVAGVAVLLSSPRIAAVFAEQWRLAPPGGAPPRLLAISPAAARAVAGLGDVEVAHAPTLAALLDLV